MSGDQARYNLTPVKSATEQMQSLPAAVQKHLQNLFQRPLYPTDSVYFSLYIDRRHRQQRAQQLLAHLNLDPAQAQELINILAG